MVEKLDAIFQVRLSAASRTIHAAENLSACFNTMTNDSAVAMSAHRRERVDCTLEAIEDVMLPSNNYFERLVVFIFANFACWHI
jgi:hypothetical protein